MPGRAEVRYRKCHSKNPEILSTGEDVDRMIDSLLAGPGSENLAQLHSLQRTMLPSGYPDHELLVGVNAHANVGVLAFAGDEGNMLSLGDSAAIGEVLYYIMGHDTEFPAYAEIPILGVRCAVKEFIASGGLRPTCIEWRKPEFW